MLSCVSQVVDLLKPVVQSFARQKATSCRMILGSWKGQLVFSKVVTSGSNVCLISLDRRLIGVARTH